MQEKYRNYLTRCLEEFGARHQVDRYVELFPELDSRLVKFAAGIYLWNMNGLIDIDNPDDVSRVRIMLKVIDETPGFDFFDNAFNEVDPDTVCGIIGISFADFVEDGKIVVEHDYSVKEIKEYQDAHSYFESVSWCIVISEESFKEYTLDGSRFFFCAIRDWQEVPCVPGMSFPHDKYGYSLIAVQVTPDNRIASVTSRWNTTGEFLSPEELRRVLGEEKFNQLFS